jgi:hypothetical protein
MEQKRDLSFEVENTDQLNRMLTGLLMDLRRGSVDFNVAKGITLIADKINKNNVNQIEYKKITKHSRSLKFFQEDQTNE